MPFREIAGHRRLLTLLSRAVARDTLPPSLLFGGPAGIGKRRTAIATAKALNCLHPVRPAAAADSDKASLEIDACGACASCRRIDRGVHPDVLVVEPGDTGSIKIDQLREVIDRAGYRPFEARRRVVIIDDAEAMGAPAQSAMLKTLEEPPSASIFVLVSSLPDSLLPTILSRCSRLRFARLAVPEIAHALVRDHGYAESEARAAATEAGGSLARALSAEAADVVQARDAARKLLERAASADAARRLDAARDITAAKGTSASERDRLAVCLRAAASLLRDVGLLAEGADESVLANADLRATLDSLTRAYDSRRSTKAYAAVDEALAALERNASPKVVADWLALQL